MWIITGSQLAAFALSLSKMGLHHGLCLVPGSSGKAPHRITNGVIHRHPLLFNFDATAPQPTMDGRSIGINKTNYEATAEMAIGLPPQHLQELAIIEQDLPAPREWAQQSSADQTNPKPVAGAMRVEVDIRATW